MAKSRVKSVMMTAMIVTMVSPSVKSEPIQVPVSVAPNFAEEMARETRFRVYHVDQTTVVPGKFEQLPAIEQAPVSEEAAATRSRLGTLQDLLWSLKGRLGNRFNLRVIIGDSLNRNQISGAEAVPAAEQVIETKAVKGTAGESAIDAEASEPKKKLPRLTIIRMALQEFLKKFHRAAPAGEASAAHLVGGAVPPVDVDAGSVKDATLIEVIPSAEEEGNSKLMAEAEEAAKKSPNEVVITKAGEAEEQVKAEGAPEEDAKNESKKSVRQTVRDGLLDLRDKVKNNKRVVSLVESVLTTFHVPAKRVEIHEGRDAFKLGIQQLVKLKFHNLTGMKTEILIVAGPESSEVRKLLVAMEEAKELVPKGTKVRVIDTSTLQVYKSGKKFLESSPINPQSGAINVKAVKSLMVHYLEAEKIVATEQVASLRTQLESVGDSRQAEEVKRLSVELEAARKTRDSLSNVIKSNKPPKVVVTPAEAAARIRPAVKPR